ncbi:MAG: ABC transporter substrate-binding protein, partial [Salinispira sp.]
MNKKQCIILMLIVVIVIVLIVVFTQSMSGDGNAAGAQKGELVINSNLSDPVPKAAFNAMVDKFRAAYPDIDVTLNEFDHEAYKTAIRNFLVSNPPDIALWFAGNRMKFFVDQGLIADVSDLWDDADFNDSMSSSLAAFTVDGSQYGVPWGYYQWGVYYRTDIFDQYGLSVPTNWDEFLEVGDTLVANGVTPVSIGTRFLWTAAGWFDYLNLRINGYDFHIGLTDGDISYLDPRLDRVFEVWADLLNRGFF